MQFLLLIYGDEKVWEAQDQADRAGVLAEYGAFTRAVEAAGALRGGEELHSTAAATTVRVREGKTLTTHGPFAETREQLGGFYLLECDSPEAAAAWAAQIPAARTGSVEVRPVVQF
ncbi:MAG: hypothetical protein JNK29_04425 [Anaerolineales bacterium]|nr:hypothetical protein [Anaerolineales bacterium]